MEALIVRQTTLIDWENFIDNYLITDIIRHLIAIIRRVLKSCKKKGRKSTADAAVVAAIFLQAKLSSSKSFLISQPMNMVVYST